MNPEQPKSPLRNRQGEPISKVEAIIFFSFIGISAGIALWIQLADIWPANYISDLQAKLFSGYYYPKLTFAAIWVVMLIICAIPTKLILTIIQKTKNKRS